MYPSENELKSHIYERLSSVSKMIMNPQAWSGNTDITGKLKEAEEKLPDAIMSICGIEDGTKENMDSLVRTVNGIGKDIGVGDIVPVPQTDSDASMLARTFARVTALPRKGGVDIIRYMGVMRDNDELSRVMRDLSDRIHDTGGYEDAAGHFFKNIADTRNVCGEKIMDYLDSIDTVNAYWKKLSDLMEKEGDRLDGAMDGILADVRDEGMLLRDGRMDRERTDAFTEYMEKVTDGLSRKLYGADGGSGKEGSLMDAVMETAYDAQQRYRWLSFDAYEKEPSVTAGEIMDAGKKASLCLSMINHGLFYAGVSPVHVNPGSMNVIQSVRNMRNAAMKMEGGTDGAERAEDRKEVPYDGEKPEFSEEEVEDTAEWMDRTVRRADGFADRFREMYRESLMQHDENAPDYEATEMLKEAIDRKIGALVEASGDGMIRNRKNMVFIMEDEESVEAQRKALSELSRIIVGGTGHQVFGAEESRIPEMDDREIMSLSAAVSSVMAPLKDGEGKYLAGFADMYGAGSEEQPETGRMYTDLSTELMLIGQKDAAMEVAAAHKEMLEISTRYGGLCSMDDASSVSPDAGKEMASLQKDAENNAKRMERISDLFRPLCMKVGVLIGVTAYRRHEYNKKWKEAASEQGMAKMMESTVKQWEISQQENQRHLDEKVQGLLRG